MQFGVLGPVQVWTPAGVVEVGGGRQRRLLAALLLQAGEVASTDRLIDIVFEGVPPSGASTTIRSYVARLRKALGDAESGAEQLISTEQGGYRLRIDLDTVDAVCFEASIETARSRLAERDPVGAASTLREGLAMWRGDAYGEFTYEEWARLEVSRLEELKTVAEEELNDALLACGLAHDVVSATGAQVDEHPLRERLRAQHMLALYRAGRQVEALRSLDDFQHVLVEVGLEPSEELIRLGRSIAAHDPALRLDSPAGQPLRGYRIGAPLGEGAHGIVYRGVQPGVGREVAIKTIRAQLADDPEFIRRFDAEAQLVANLEHPHVVPIYDYWREPGGAYIVMRLLPDNLLARLAAGPMAASIVATIARQLGSALAAAHQSGLVHGDIKPSNVLVDDPSTYLADFGVATLVESAAEDGSAYPSSGYESPELLAGEPPSPASDQFAFAVLLVHLLTGQLPFGSRAMATRHDRSPSIHVQRPSIPALVDDVVWKATSWHAANRYADVVTFVDHFEAALTGQANQEHVDREIANPYRGLRAFTEVDRAVFFGRDGVVDELVQRLEREGAKRRFVVAIGASGSGKSSAVRAGLLPRIRAGAVPGSDDWLITTMTPGSDPFAELDAALRSVAVSDPGERVAAPDESEVLRLLDTAVPRTQPVLLVIDQLEELFTQVGSETARRHFVNGLTRAVDHPGSNLRVVATLRADYLDRPLRYSEFGRLVKDGAVTVVGMSAPELESAVTRPAAGVGVEVEPALATQLVADVLDQPAALPLLQFTLTELFEHRNGPVLTLESYRGLGGVDAAVASRAEGVFGRLSPTGRELARHVFLRLVTVDESRSVSRRRTLRSDLVSTANEPDAMNIVIDAFGGSRLLTFDHDHDSREPTVEIAHEALIDQWPRFTQWVASEGDGLRVQALLTEATRTWEQQGRDDGDLYRGIRLESALELAEARPDMLNPLEREFLTASADARSLEIEVERAQAERDRRTNRRLQGLLTAVGLLLVAALVTGALAIRQQRRADDEAAAARTAAGEAERQSEAAVAAAEEADLATLVARSAAAAADRPEQALLLALEAYRRSPGATTERALLDVIAAGAIDRQVAAIPRLPPRGGCGGWVSSRQLSHDGLREFAVVEGELIAKDLVTGRTIEYGRAPDPCVRWFEDARTGLRHSSTTNFYRHWMSSAGGSWQSVERSRNGGALYPEVVNDRLLYGQEGQSSWGDVVVVDAQTLEPVGQAVAALGFDEEEAFPATTASHGAGLFAVGSHSPEGPLDPSGGGLLVVLDAATGAALHSVPRPARVTAVGFDRDGSLVFAGDENGLIGVIDVATGEVIDELTPSERFETIAIGARADGVLVSVGDRQVITFDLEAGSTGQSIRIPRAEEARIRPDGTVVVAPTGAADTLLIIDPNRGPLVETGWHVGSQGLVSFGPGRAGVVDTTGDIEVIDLASGDRAGLELTAANGERFDALAVVPEADGFLAWDDGTTVARWRRGDLVEQLALWTGLNDASLTRGDVGNPEDVPAGGFAGQGAMVVFDDLPFEESPLEAYFFDPTPGRLVMLSVIESPPFSTVSVAPAPGGGSYVVLDSGIVRTYDRSGEQTGQVETGLANPQIAITDPETGLIGLGGEDGAAILDPSEDVVQVVRDVGTVVSLGFARDGTRLVLVDSAGTVRLWDISQAELVGTLWAGNGTASPSPPLYDPATDSAWVATSGMILQFSLDPNRWVERACDLVSGTLTPEEWNRLVPGETEQRPACD